MALARDGKGGVVGLRQGSNVATAHKYHVAMYRPWEHWGWLEEGTKEKAGSETSAASLGSEDALVRDPQPS